MVALSGRTAWRRRRHAALACPSRGSDFGRGGAARRWRRSRRWIDCARGLDPRDAETAGGAQSYAVDPVVRRIQEFLAELGFYLGPFDGKLNGETAGAIRRYQRENRLVVNGVASRALLDGLELKNQARQIEAARMALLASPATRAFVRGRDPAEQGDPRRDVRGCFAVPSPRCLIEEALESAKGIHRERFYDWVIGQILIVQVKAGMRTVALDTVARLEDPRLVMVALRNISSAEAEIGEVAAALAMAQRIPAPGLRAEALAAVAAAQAAAGDPELQSKVALILTRSRDPVDGHHAASTLSRLAVRLFAAGAPALAETTLAAAAARADALARIEVATALAAMDRPSDALATLPELATAARPAEIAVAIARRGDYATAAAHAATVDEARYRVLVLADIASLQTRAGHAAAAHATMAEAVVTAGEITAERDFGLSYAGNRIARAWIDVGDAIAALDAAAQIENPGLRAHALALIAVAQARIGAPAAAQTERLAQDALAAIPNALDRAWTLSDIALDHHRNGADGAALAAFRRALDTAKAIEVAWARAQALGKIAATLIQLR